METIVFALLNGVIYGLLLFMLSSGLTLIFSMMGVLNFAHASFYMLGAYFAFTISGSSSFWIASSGVPFGTRTTRCMKPMSPSTPTSAKVGTSS